MLKFGKPIFNYWFLIPLLINNLESNYIAIRKPPKNYEEEYILMKQLKKGKKLIGLSSYADFPKNYEIFLKKYEKYFILWCHCFKNVQNYIPCSLPKLLLSESDFYDNYKYLQTLNYPKEYDFICYLPFNSKYKNANKKDVLYLNTLFEKYKIIVFTNKFYVELKVEQKLLLPWDKFIIYFAKSKFLLIFSELDASPRMIIESLFLDIPVFVNKNIIGGWKYIIPNVTGNFFVYENFFIQIEKFYNIQDYYPRQYIINNYSIKNNSLLLINTLNMLDKINISDFIDYFIFINLNDRKDRLLSIEIELKKMKIPKEKIIKQEGVLNIKNGHLGCCQSHILALQKCALLNGNYFLILEDDFTFSLSTERTGYIIKEFFIRKPNFNVLMFYAFPNYEIINNNDYIYKINNASSTIGYLIRKEMINPLLTSFYKSEELLIKETNDSFKNKIYYTKNAIDQVWKELQTIYDFFITEPNLGQPNPKLISSILS